MSFEIKSNLDFVVSVPESSLQISHNPVIFPSNIPYSGNFFAQIFRIPETPNIVGFPCLKSYFTNQHFGTLTSNPSPQHQKLR